MYKRSRNTRNYFATSSHPAEREADKVRDDELNPTAVDVRLEGEYNDENG